MRQRVRHRLALDRPLLLGMLASVVVYAVLGVVEVSGSEWGMVRSLAPYQAVLVAVLTGSVLTHEFERGTIQWALTQPLSRRAWLRWRLLVPGLATLAGAFGLGAVLTVVRDRAPSVWMSAISDGELIGYRWQAPVGAALLGFGAGVLTAVVVRRTVATVSIAGAGTVAASVLADLVRSRLQLADRAAPGADAWAVLAGQALIGAVLLALASSALRRTDV